MSEQDLYAGREQTGIKHFILRKYLERFAHIIGSRWYTITYVDCFSGPWKSQSDELKDTSFAIALNELRKARNTHAERGRQITLRAMFLERDAAAYAKLQEFAAKVEDVTVETRNSDLAGAINDVIEFVRQGGRSSSFPFFFIDPTGWTGFAMNLIAPLLREQPGEVLINFMTDYIRRFIDHPQQQTSEQFAELFGSGDVKDQVLALTDPQEREDALFTTYAQNVKKTGEFAYACAAIILYPDKDRRFFHLIYATRSRKGVEVFKEVEQRAMGLQEQTRAKVKQRKRVEKSQGQLELFAAEDMPHSNPIEGLRSRYLERARQAVLTRLQVGIPVPYEDVWDLALSAPLVWECDLKDWISGWRNDGAFRINGMKPRERVPKVRKNHLLVWQGTSSS
jgi:three-Cys-motif partner protein